MLVKLCGFSEINSLKSAVENGCNFVGFVFYENSIRNISVQKAISLSKVIPANIAKVAVVVNPNDEILEEISFKFKPNFMQFHGDENVDYIKKFKQKFPEIKVIKSFRIASKQDLSSVDEFEKVADYFLFDSKSQNHFGGSGESFDWNILKELKTTKKWFLSGGINKENIHDAIKKTNAKMIDLSSAIEEEKGVKSPKLIAELMKIIKNNS